MTTKKDWTEFKQKIEQLEKAGEDATEIITQGLPLAFLYYWQQVHAPQLKRIKDKEKHKAIRNTLEEAFYAGATTVMLTIQRAHELQKSGAIIKAMENLDEGITKYSQKRILNHLGEILKDLT